MEGTALTCISARGVHPWDRSDTWKWRQAACDEATTLPPRVLLVFPRESRRYPSCSSPYCPFSGNAARKFSGTFAERSPLHALEMGKETDKCGAALENPQREQINEISSVIEVVHNQNVKFVLKQNFNTSVRGQYVTSSKLYNVLL